MSITENTETSREPLWLLAEMASELHTALDLDTLRLILSRSLRWLLSFDRCTLAYYPNPADDCYTLFDITSPMRVLNHVPQTVPLAEGWAGRVLRDGKPRYLSDLAHALAEGEPDAPQTGLCDAARSLMLLPLRIGDRALGVLCLSAESLGTFSVEFRTVGSLLAAQVAGQIGAILIHAQTRDALREMCGSQERLREMAQQLSHQASHDALTGLVNRREFERRLADYVRTARSGNEVHTLCAIDLDRFKVVNDSCGHAAGDALLRQIATLVRMHVRETDVLARLGGDEFAVLLPHCTAAAAERVVTAVRETIRGLRFVWDDREFQVSGSVGMTEITAASTTVEEVLHAADAACYISKHGGRDRVSRYQPDGTQVAAVRGDTQWAREIAAALDEGRFRLFFQTVVPLTAEADAGERFEVLLRLRDTDGVLVSPAAFFPAAERFGLLPAIDRWVIRATFAACARFNADPAYRLHTCFVNLSGASLGDDTLFAYIEEQFAAHAVAPEQICFDITEAAVNAHLAASVGLMDQLRRRGCRLALDNFGSGLSSFMYLKNLPVDFLKIASVFIAGLTRNPLDQAVLAAINDIGHIMGIETIAECVEDETTLTRLAEMGVDYVQGYRLARPQPLDELTANTRRQGAGAERT